MAKRFVQRNRRAQMRNDRRNIRLAIREEILEQASLRIEIPALLCKIEAELDKIEQEIEAITRKAREEQYAREYWEFVEDMEDKVFNRDFWEDDVGESQARFLADEQEICAGDIV